MFAAILVLFYEVVLSAVWVHDTLNVVLRVVGVQSYMETCRLRSDIKYTTSPFEQSVMFESPKGEHC